MGMIIHHQNAHLRSFDGTRGYFFHGYIFMQTSILAVWVGVGKLAKVGTPTAKTASRLSEAVLRTPCRVFGQFSLRLIYDQPVTSPAYVDDKNRLLHIRLNRFANMMDVPFGKLLRLLH